MFFWGERNLQEYCFLELFEILFWNSFWILMCLMNTYKHEVYWPMTVKRYFDPRCQKGRFLSSKFWQTVQINYDKGIYYWIWKLCSAHMFEDENQFWRKRKLLMEIDGCPLKELFEICRNPINLYKNLLLVPKKCCAAWPAKRVLELCKHGHVF